MLMTSSLHGMQKEQTGTIDVAALDMRPQDWAAFEASVARGELGHLITPWQPWWMTQEAVDLRLSDGGQCMVQGMQCCSSAVLARDV